MNSTIALLQTSPQPTMEAAFEETMALASDALKSGAQFLITPEYCGGLQSDGPKPGLVSDWIYSDHRHQR